MKHKRPLRILAPAKINLFLQIIGKRADGYHDLASLMCCVGLYDEIIISVGKHDTSVVCEHPEIPRDESNLAHRAATLFLDKLKTNQGAEIILKKRIPVAGGLGGGSSNAAAVLLGLNHHFDEPFSRDQLMAMGLALGADVPFFIFQKPALATGIGEILEAYTGLAPYHILLVNPGFSVSTAEIYRNLNLRLTKCKKKITNALLKNRGFDAALHLCNDLETVTASTYPEIHSIKEQLIKYEALGALMSGSGPSVFGIFSEIETARSARDALTRNSGWQVYLADLIVDSGIRVGLA
ncbi:MAG: 4-(cytidine 5'-diphospho)-2-C-methyl-D-erythritol kinase [Deltaproteobacteria bacterium]|nr:4-(cytidine 5'-diphospho)-2-C-methyl-D-erythritol kinase [Deltaproteobacteria bacterium]